MPDGPVNVLLIEDDEDDFVLTKDLFAELPDGAYHLDRVADYPSALHALDHCDHHLYLVDYRLGSHTGLELVVEAIKRGCNKPMIMLTGQSEREFDLQAMRAGAVDYLIKDQLTAGMLERSMRYALRHSQQAEEIRQANQQLEQRVLERTEALGEANSALTESQRFLRSVLDALPIHIAVLDEAGAVLAVNAAWRRFADENEPPPGEDCIGQNFLEECLSERNPCGPHTELAQGIRYVLQGGLPGYQTEYPCHTPREHRWFQTQVSPFPRPGPVLAVVAREDTTSRVQSEQALRRQSRQLQELSRIATRFNVAHDVRSTLEILADAAQSIIGAHQCVSCQIADFDWSKAVCVSRISDKYLDWRDRDWPMGSGLERAICRGNHALRLTQDDAERHPAWLAPDYDGESRPPLRGLLAAPLVGHDGRNLGLVQLSDKFDGQEFTEEDAAILVQLAQMASVALENAFLYRDLRAADVRKDQFLATLAHELRNPLSPLTAATQLLGLDPDNTSQVRELTQVMTRQVEQLRRLIDDLLDVSRVTSGKLALRREPFSLGEAVAAALDTVRPLCQAASQKLEVVLSGQPAIVQGDKVRLAQAIGNLLINSSKYTPPGGRVDLELRLEKQSAAVHVRDSGIGIPPDALQRIFGLFAQVDSSSTRTQGGLGIGLTLARTLVELHGGTITAASAGTGMGSEFVVRIPLAEPGEHGLAALADADDGSPLPSYRVMLVDDNESASHLVGRLLGKLGQEIEIAHSVPQALEIIHRFRPHLIISDIAMPGESGYNLAQRVQQLKLEPPPVLIALTGYGQVSDQQAALQAGFSRHLTKPIGLAELQQVLRSLL